MEFPVLNVAATGARIKELRRNSHYTVEQVRDYLGLESVQAIYKWQRGDCLPTVDNLYGLSKLFNTTVDDLLVGDREEPLAGSSFYADIYRKFFHRNRDNLDYNRIIAGRKRQE